jgi:hypothetical protein
MALTGWKEQGRIEGQRQLLRKMLESRFGPLPVSVIQTIDGLPVERVEDLALRFPQADSLKALGFEAPSAPEA